MDVEKARAVLAEIKRRGAAPATKQKKPNTKSYPYYDALFKEQKAFINDPSTSKTALCTRRAGKTHSTGAYLIKEAESWDNCEVTYITLTRKNAKELMWPVLMQMNRKYRLGMKPNISDLTMTTQNGSIIYLKGAEDKAEMEKLRGHAFKLAAIDEAGSFGPHIEAMVAEILEPTLLDGNGTIILTGTPNAACVGKFHDVTNGIEAGWSNHEWTVYDNPFIPHAKTWVQKNIIEKRKLSWKHPVVMREWLGRWVRSLDSLVYRFDEKRNIFEEGEYPKDSMYILSIDLGYHDQTVITVGAFSESSPDYYIIDGMGESNMLPHQIAKRIKSYMKQYEFVKIKCDTGGLGKSIVEEFIERYSIPVEAAEKTNKKDFIEHMNSDFERGNLKISSHLKECSSQFKVLQWDEKRKKEDERYKNDWCDSVLYNWREGKHWVYQEPEEKLDPNTDEYMNKYWEEESEKMEKEQSYEEGYDENGIFGHDE